MVARGSKLVAVWRLWVPGEGEVETLHADDDDAESAVAGPFLFGFARLGKAASQIFRRRLCSIMHNSQMSVTSHAP